MNKQRWVAFDQWLHTLYDPSAMADETFSARCWREHLQDPKSKKWARYVRIIDKYALKWFDDKDHCRASFESEVNRSQLPTFYRRLYADCRK